MMKQSKSCSHDWRLKGNEGRPGTISPVVGERRREMHHGSSYCCIKCQKEVMVR